MEVKGKEELSMILRLVFGLFNRRLLLVEMEKDFDSIVLRWGWCNGFLKFGFGYVKFVE